MDTNQGVALLRAFTCIEKDIQNSTMMVFLAIARNPGISQIHLEAELGLSNAQASRNVSYWTDDVRRGVTKEELARGIRDNGGPVKGPGYVCRKENPSDRRYKLLDLTPLGREFYRAILESQNGQIKKPEMAS